MMKRTILFTILFAAAYKGYTQIAPQLTVSEGATHVLRVTEDTVYVVSGSTYAYTVDTKEGQGLVSTTPTAAALLAQFHARTGTVTLLDRAGAVRTGAVQRGDRLLQSSGGRLRSYVLALAPAAIGGTLQLEQSKRTASATAPIRLLFTAGQRTPDATVRISIPAGIRVTPNNTYINVIGRGEVLLRDLPTQSIGRAGSAYSYKRVGSFVLGPGSDGSTVLTLRHLDLRPANGADIVLRITGVRMGRPGTYTFRAVYETAEPARYSSPGAGSETAEMTVTSSISDLERVAEAPKRYREDPGFYTSTRLRWGGAAGPFVVEQSVDGSGEWTPVKNVRNTRGNTADISGLVPDRLYRFRVYIKDGPQKGYSNEVRFFSGKLDVRRFGADGADTLDDTRAVNAAIDSLYRLGGGTLLFAGGTYRLRTVQLRSNVFLYIASDATLQAIKGGDAPEATWFSDRKYRSGLSPTDAGPYEEPDNWLTKQDVGHHYFRNSMFFGERLDNVKIVGNGRITGAGVLVTSDKVMNNAPDNRCDKMFALKLCTNVEIGGLARAEDLWYDEAKDAPYYIGKNGNKDFEVENMLHIDRAGHFALLATGTDSLFVHDTYFAKAHSGNARDIYDFMQCNDVTVANIYSKVSSDDIVKPGSDCSLGFTRPARRFRVRNIIGDTNCNLFQVGSETADDIRDACVDNIYVLGANKAGFSISANDGARVSDIHLNCGHTGPLHARSQMRRTTTPFFISISNRGRVLGAKASRVQFTEDGVAHDELLINNINIGIVENVFINGVDVSEVYGGSSFGDAGARWKPFDGKQRSATPIVAGYALPDSSQVAGGRLPFRLADGRHTGTVRNIRFTDVRVTVKGGHPASDTAAVPPELGVGQYNVSNLKVQPSYGLWARHVRNLAVENCSFKYEKEDGRYVIYLDDVAGARFSGVAWEKSGALPSAIGMKKTTGLQVQRPVANVQQREHEPVPPRRPAAAKSKNVTTSQIQ
ncbi:endopygalactorunase [Flaviaesturariibacter flavus]|uniref:Endopygalactorunase n=1 Tax=Flaviaesturariibacter flavus TaxID=2502780 RepID=A0A4R1BQN0_9BACT|nr:endopygalactorunase [Flaviaesturariibacter flavus]TCJ19576.1 endopygalactorunase [Flaviaesturariibacter flavus]